MSSENTEQHPPNLQKPSKEPEKSQRTSRARANVHRKDKVQYAWKSGDSWVARLPMEWVNKYHPELQGFYPVIFDDDDEFISLVLAETPDKLDSVEIFIPSGDIDKFRFVDNINKETKSAKPKTKVGNEISKNRAASVEDEKKRRETLNEAEKSYNKLLRKIVSCYLVGFNSIHVLCDKDCSQKTLPEWPLDRLTEFIMTKGKLYGARCRKNTSIECLDIRVNIDFEQDPLRDALDKMCGYAEDALDKSIKLLERFDQNEFENLQNFEDEVDARYFYIVRASKVALRNPHLIREMNLRNFRELMGYRVIAKPIERIADHSYKIAYSLKQLVEENGGLDTSAKKVTVGLAKDVRGVFDSMTRSLAVKGGFFGEAFRGEGSYVQSTFFDAANDLIEKANSVIDDEERIFRELNRKQENEESGTSSRKSVLEIWSERIILESLRRIADYTITVGQVILNLSVESRLEKEERAKAGNKETVYLLKPTWGREANQ